MKGGNECESDPRVNWSNEKKEGKPSVSLHGLKFNLKLNPAAMEIQPDLIRWFFSAGLLHK